MTHWWMKYDNFRCRGVEADGEGGGDEEGKILMPPLQRIP